VQTTSLQIEKHHEQVRECFSIEKSQSPTYSCCFLSFLWLSMITACIYTNRAVMQSKPQQQHNIMHRFTIRQHRSYANDEKKKHQMDSELLICQEGIAYQLETARKVGSQAHLLDLCFPPSAVLAHTSGSDLFSLGFTE